MAVGKSTFWQTVIGETPLGKMAIGELTWYPQKHQKLYKQLSQGKL